MLLWQWLARIWMGRFVPLFLSVWFFAVMLKLDVFTRWIAMGLSPWPLLRALLSQGLVALPILLPVVTFLATMLTSHTCHKLGLYRRWLINGIAPSHILFPFCMLGITLSCLSWPLYAQWGPRLRFQVDQDLVRHLTQQSLAYHTAIPRLAMTTANHQTWIAYRTPSDALFIQQSTRQGKQHQLHQAFFSPQRQRIVTESFYCHDPFIPLLPTLQQWTQAPPLNVQSMQDKALAGLAFYHKEFHHDALQTRLWRAFSAFFVLLFTMMPLVFLQQKLHYIPPWLLSCTALTILLGVKRGWILTTPTTIVALALLLTLLTLWSLRRGLRCI